jgi:Fe-S oxidoreductase
MALEDYKDIIHRCFRCGYCKLVDSYSLFNCPSYDRFHFETYSPGGRMWLIRAWMKEEIQWTDSLAKILYSCTTCNNCVEHCKFPFSNDIVNIIVAAREKMVENGLVLSQVARFFRNIEATSNPYRELPKDRGKWAEGTGISQYKGQEYLYYVGCIGSYDARGQEAARALGEVLSKAGLSFGVLGSEEKCDGNEVKMLGEKRIFEMLVERNIQLFSDLGVTNIVTLSPHSFNAFKNYYPPKFKIFHYTQLLCHLIKEGRLDLSKGLNAKVTYHDPCFLGRHNGEYQSPRDILNAIPGIELLEMERNRENAFCCGGGSGNFYVDFFGGGENSPARIRIREAYETGADILAVACPACLTMLSDAVKSEGMEQQLVVKDVSEIVKESLNN